MNFSTKKTPLIWTSKYSLIDNFPVLIRLNDLGKISSESDYNSGSKIIGILLEGKFTSFFKNRIIDFKIGNKNFIQDHILNQTFFSICLQ